MTEAEALGLSETLKPCPFCGGAGALVAVPIHNPRDARADDWCCECADCDISLPCCGSKQEAIGAWNRRAPVVVTDEVVELALCAWHQSENWTALYDRRAIRLHRQDMRAAIEAALRGDRT